MLLSNGEIYSVKKYRIQNFKILFFQCILLNRLGSNLNVNNETISWNSQWFRFEKIVQKFKINKLFKLYVLNAKLKNMFYVL